MKSPIQKPFTHPFLSDFILTPANLPFSDKEIIELDSQLSEYEQIFLNPDIETTLITKNELLASFAISKAENSRLTLPQAQDVYRLISTQDNPDFIQAKLKSRRKLTQNDHDRLEFFNIAKTFRHLNQNPITIDQLSAEVILNLHSRLTGGLDIFQEFLPGFTPYKSRKWRDNDNIRVGEYVPAPHIGIKSGLKELISWLKRHQTPTGVAVFHTALYGLHPFQNGNKRVCRILEHVLIRGLGLNPKNLYSPSYYYHRQKPRYYKYLLYSLERRNLNHFVSFILEAIALSIFSVVKTSLEFKRNEFLARQTTAKSIRSALKPLVKRGQVQFKNLARYNRSKIARQTLVTYLQKAVDQGIIQKQATGRTTYYRLNFDSPESSTLLEWQKLIRAKLEFIPDEFKLT